jgi:G:T-mismatch repair DNA endonuclease (very short patch repair protein)
MFCNPLCRKEFIVKDGKELGKDYVICQICKRACSNITGIHMKTYHPEWTPASYRETFPDSPVLPSSTRDKIVEGSKKAGARMREPEHRKRMSESLKGENNPMHRSNTTDEMRRSISPFSPDFYIKKDPTLSREEAEAMAKDKLKSNEIVSWVKEEYWISKGHTQEEAKQIVSEKQSTFSLAKCIEKYGEEGGTNKWKARQERWKSKVFNDTVHISRGYSKVGEEFIELLVSKINERNIEDDLLYGKSEKFIKNKESRVYKFDLTLSNSKKIIEFNGDYWHCNPSIYSEDYYNRVKKMTAKEIWDYDKDKNETAKDYGYSIFYIWESEYRNNPEETIEKCLKFILE